MRRPLRIDFAGALYHVMSRGNRREDIFRDETDRVWFLDTLDAAWLKGVCFRGLEGLAPGFDLNGNLTTVNYPAGKTDLTYSYDALNRMTNLVDAVGTTKYRYAHGLLATEDGPWCSDTVSLSYHNSRERSQLVLIQPTGNAWTNRYVWDADHRLSTMASSAGTHTYTYDAENQLVSVEQASSWKLEYTYNGRQRLRIVKDYEYSGGSYTLRSETRYVYDGKLLLQERNSSGHPTVTYSRGRDLSGSFEGAGGMAMARRMS